MTLACIMSGELTKLRTLPAVTVTVFGTIGSAIVLAAAIAASSTVPIGSVQVALASIPFLQIGIILLGVLAVASEYQSGQIRTTLTATPRRLTALSGKALAFLMTAAVTSGVAVGAAWLAAALTLSLRDVSAEADLSPGPLVGAAVYLVLIGALAFAVTVLVRSLIAPLVTMLSLVLIVSPLAVNLTEHARWLPDRAGSILYMTGTDAVLDAGTGAFVLLAWIAAAGVAAGTAFAARDA